MALLKHPLFLLIAGAVVTGYLIPTITRYWQDRQKELEQRTSLVGDISENVMKIVMAIQFAHVAKANLSASEDPGSVEERRRLMELLNAAYMEWQIRSAVIGTRLEAYFRGGDDDKLPEDWSTFSQAVERFYALEGVHTASWQGNAAALGVMLQQLKSPAQALDWQRLKEAVLACKATMIQRVLHSSMPVFRTRLLPRILLPLRRPN